MFKKTTFLTLFFYIFLLVRFCKLYGFQFHNKNMLYTDLCCYCVYTSVVYIRRCVRMSEIYSYSGTEKKTNEKWSEQWRKGRVEDVWMGLAAALAYVTRYQSPRRAVPRLHLLCCCCGCWPRVHAMLCSGPVRLPTLVVATVLPIHMPTLRSYSSKMSISIMCNAYIGFVQILTS